MPDPASSKANLRDRWRKQLSKLKQYADEDHQAITGEMVPFWYRPEMEGWDGSLFDIEGMKKPFIRKEHEDDFDKVVNKNSPGVVGDYSLVVLQGDFLAVVERSFRARHHTNIRQMMHAATRRMGHGHEKGLFEVGVKGYLEYIDKQAKGDGPQ